MDFSSLYVLVKVRATNSYIVFKTIKLELTISGYYKCILNSETYLGIKESGHINGLYSLEINKTVLVCSVASS